MICIMEIDQGEIFLGSMLFSKNLKSLLYTSPESCNHSYDGKQGT